MTGGGWLELPGSSFSPHRGSVRMNEGRGVKGWKAVLGTEMQEVSITSSLLLLLFAARFSFIKNIDTLLFELPDRSRAF